MNLPDAGKILDNADIKLKKLTKDAHYKVSTQDGPFTTPKALGYYAALQLARDAYEMGMLDAFKAIEQVREMKL